MKSTEPSFEEVIARLEKLPRNGLPARTGDRLTLEEPPRLTFEEMVALGERLRKEVSVTEEPLKLPKPEDEKENVQWDFADLNKHCTIDYLVLADAVDVQNGKQYIHAAGWTGAMIGQFPGQMRWASAFRMRVPWEATNIDHSIKVDVVDQDNVSILTEKQTYEINVNVGRPPKLPHGMDQAIPIGIDMSQVLFPTTGIYSVNIDVDGRWAAKTTIHIVQAPFPTNP